VNELQHADTPQADLNSGRSTVPALIAPGTLPSPQRQRTFEDLSSDPQVLARLMLPMSEGETLQEHIVRLTQIGDPLATLEQAAVTAVLEVLQCRSARQQLQRYTELIQSVTVNPGDPGAASEEMVQTAPPPGGVGPEGTDEVASTEQLSAESVDPDARPGPAEASPAPETPAQPATPDQQAAVPARPETKTSGTKTPGKKRPAAQKPVRATRKSTPATGIVGQLRTWVREQGDRPFTAKEACDALRAKNKYIVQALRDLTVKGQVHVLSGSTKIGETMVYGGGKRETADRPPAAELAAHTETTPDLNETPADDTPADDVRTGDDAPASSNETPEEAGVDEALPGAAPVEETPEKTRIEEDVAEHVPTEVIPAVSGEERPEEAGVDEALPGAAPVEETPEEPGTEEDVTEHVPTEVIPTVSGEERSEEEMAEASPAEVPVAGSDTDPEEPTPEKDIPHTDTLDTTTLDTDALDRMDNDQIAAVLQSAWQKVETRPAPPVGVLARMSEPDAHRNTPGVPSWQSTPGGSRDASPRLSPVPDSLPKDEREVFDTLRRESSGMTDKLLAARLNWRLSRTQESLKRLEEDTYIYSQGNVYHCHRSGRSSL